MLIAQITDCHVVERGELLAGRVDTAAALHAAIDHLHAMSPRPDVVLATGDLVNDGLPAQYEQLASILDGLEIPVHAVPGNHDHRDELRQLFPHLPDGLHTEGRLDHVVDEYPVRLVGLDTTVPGEHGGRVSETQMSWLDRVLSSDADRPTLVFQHHPPFVTGIDWMDEVGLDGRELEAATIARHPNVLGVVCGHVHRPITAAFGGTVASCWPSTGAQVALALDGGRYRYVDDAAGVAVHRWHPVDGFVSHLSPVTSAGTWLPAWAAREAAREAAHDSM
ncbi:phosphodiesterase [soil metagenome]